MNSSSDFNDFEGDDASITFRVNSKLKEDFNKLCRQEQFTVSVAFKRYMLQCVNKGYVSEEFIRSRSNFRH